MYEIEIQIKLENASILRRSCLTRCLFLTAFSINGNSSILFRLCAEGDVGEISRFTKKVVKCVITIIVSMIKTMPINQTRTCTVFVMTNGAIIIYSHSNTKLCRKWGQRRKRTRGDRQRRWQGAERRQGFWDETEASFKNKGQPISLKVLVWYSQNHFNCSV